MIGWDKDASGCVTLTMDAPNSRVNTLTPAFVDALTEALDRVQEQADTVSGIIVASAKRSFCAGGDLERLGHATAADAAELTAEFVRLKRQFRRLETLGVPVVAALAGSALGGGLELALSCHHRIAVDLPGIQVGLPEVTLGLLPGAGGTARTVRMLGVESALMSLIVPGTAHTVAAGQHIGVVDQSVATVEELMPAARRWIAENPHPLQPWDRPDFVLPPSPTPVPQLIARLHARTGGGPGTAIRAALAAAVEGAELDFESAFTVETRYFVHLATSDVSTNMIGAFFDTGSIQSGVNRPDGLDRSTVERVGVVGAGMMGSGIAYAAALAGIPVVLLDSDPQAVERARQAAEGWARRDSGAGESPASVVERIRAAESYADLAACDVVIEAVFESAPLKQDVLTRVEAAVGPRAMLASNTSTLAIGGLARGVQRTADLVGIHFFSPVHRMRLVEIVRAECTSDDTVARAYDFVRQLGKVPIVVRDSPGFFTSRVIMARISEALAAVADGVPPVLVERAATRAGYPVGPLQLADELSLTLLQRIRPTGEPGDPRTPAPPSSVRIVDALVKAGRTGRAGRAGFYDYDADGVRGLLWPGLAAVVDALADASSADASPEGASPVDAGFSTALLSEADPAAVDAQLGLLADRLLFAETVEALRCLDEGIVATPAEANVGSILGIGFPAWTGGVHRFAHNYAGGMAQFEARARDLAHQFGPRFAPPQPRRSAAGTRCPKS